MTKTKKSTPFVWEVNGKYRIRRYLLKHVCKTCGKKFYSKKKTTQFCSRKCVLPRGGITKRSNGYVWVKDWTHPSANKQGYVYQHRVAAEKVIGRYVESWEVVHHKDRNRTNNDPSNLEVLSQYEHACRHKEKQWSKTKFWHKDKDNCEKISSK